VRDLLNTETLLELAAGTKITTNVLLEKVTETVKQKY